MSTRPLLLACLAPAGALFAAFWLLPMCWRVVLPAAKGWDTYLAVLTNPRYALSLANTVLLSLSVTAVTLASKFEVLPITIYNEFTNYANFALAASLSIALGLMTWLVLFAARRLGGPAAGAGA